MNFRLEDPKATLKADVPWTVRVKKKHCFMDLYGFAMICLTNIWIYLDDILRSFLWLAIGLSNMLQIVYK